MQHLHTRERSNYSHQMLIISSASNDHHVRVLAKLHETQKCGFLTDLTIGSGDCVFSCHAKVLASVSGYVRGISVNCNRSNSQIPLHGISKTILSKILEYMYTGLLYITRWNAKDFLDLAIFLQLPELIQESREFLKSSVASQGKLIDHSSNVHQKILQTFRSLWKDSTTGDVTITSNSVNYLCHRLILSVRSDYFYAMFGSNMEENRKGCVQLDQIDPIILEKILAYLYYQNLTIDLDDLFYLMEVADMLQMEDLCADISVSLADQITNENSVDVYTFSKQFHVYRSLRRMTQTYIQQHFLEVSRQGNFLNLTDVNLIDIISTSSVLLHSPLVLLQALDTWYKHDVTSRTCQLINILMVLKTQLNPSIYNGLDTNCNFGPEIERHLCKVKFYRQLSPLQRLRPALNLSDTIVQSETIVMFVWTPSSDDISKVDVNTAPVMQRLQTCCFVPDSHSQSGGWCDYDNLIISSKKDSTYSIWTSVASLGNGQLIAVNQQRQILLIDIGSKSAKTIPPPCIVKSYCQVVSLDNVAYLLVIDDAGYASFFGYNHDRESWNNLSPPPSKISMSYRPIFADCVGKIFLIEEHCEQVYEPTLDLWRTRKHTSIPSFQKLRDMKAVAFNEFLIVSNWNNFFFYDTFTGLWAKGNSEFQGIPLKCRGRLFSILPDFLTGSLTIKQIPSISASKEQLSVSTKELSNHIIGIQCVSVPAALTEHSVTVL